MAYKQSNALGILGLYDISLKKGYRDFVTTISYRCNDAVRLVVVLNGVEKAKRLIYRR